MITTTLIVVGRAATRDGDRNKNGDCRHVAASIVAIPTAQ